MTLEDQILNIAEAPNWYDSRELRAIALEVRKREDRIKQLEEELHVKNEAVKRQMEEKALIRSRIDKLLARLEETNPS